MCGYASSLFGFFKHTTDNPIVNVGGRNDLWYSNSDAIKAMQVGGKNVFVNSCSNFDNTQLAVQLESVDRALAQVIHTSAWRTTQLDDTHRTNLPTYLVAKENKGGDGFANIAQSMSGLYAEAMGLTNSVMGYGVPTSIGIEETFSNVNQTADRLSKMATKFTATKPCTRRRLWICACRTARRWAKAPPSS